MYMQARYYDLVIGRFYSNDPVGYTSRNPVMSFNRYMYVNNNPYKYTDLTGMILEVKGSDEFTKKTQDNLNTLKSKPDGQALVEGIENSSNTITITESNGGNSATPNFGANAGNGKGTGGQVEFNPNNTKGGMDDNGNTERPAFVKSMTLIPSHLIPLIHRITCSAM